MIAYVNGRLVPRDKATVSIDDHGFLYGDGVYETIRVYRGRAFLLDEHLKRLANSMRGIALKPPIALVAIGRAVQKTVRANRHREAVVRLTLTRGPGPYGFDPRPCKKPTLVITSSRFHPYPRWMHERGVSAAVVSVRRNSPLALPPYVKSTSCMNGILAKMESIKLGCQEGIMLTRDGCVAEGTVSNVFAVRGGALITPRLEGDLLPGVTRGWVCRLAREAGTPVREERITGASLLSAREVFLTNTTMEVLPVARLVYNPGGRKRTVRFGPYEKRSAVGPVTRDLMERFRRSLEAIE